jgi:hypothetical protein
MSVTGLKGSNYLLADEVALGVIVGQLGILSKYGGVGEGLICGG